MGAAWEGNMSWELEERIYRRVAVASPARILYLVFDGLGGLPGPDGLTPLEAARTPNLDRLAAEGCCGSFDPVAPGITPGSGPGHLGLFGYEPMEVEVGRGVLAALGIGFPIRKGDVAARFNFCTLDSQRRVTDRRAGRIPTETNRKLVELLRRGVRVPEGVEVFFETVAEHRGLLVLRGDGLGHRLADTDPQRVGVEPLPARALDEESIRTAEIVNDIVRQAEGVLEGQGPANGLLLRGFDTLPDIPSLQDRFGLNPVCIAQYPMYRGLARLVGMEVPAPPASLGELPASLAQHWDGHDFFFCHVKYTDKAGEDGDFGRKQEVIETVDAMVPRMLELEPDVVVVTADHSTPARLRSHSWHPVPGLLWAPATVLPDEVRQFGERACQRGGLGRQRLRYLLPQALAHAGKLAKFGA